MVNNKVLGLEREIDRLISQNKNKSDVARYIQSKTNLCWSQSREYARRFFNGKLATAPSSPPSEKIDIELEFKERYVYNERTGKYIFLCKGIGKNIALPKDTVDAILKNYSNFDGEQASINEISLKFNIPRAALIEILRALEVTHDSLPVSNEDLASKDVDKVAKELLQDKRFAVFQKLQKQDWAQTQVDARKWQDFEMGLIQPLQGFLETWEPKTVIPENKNKASKANKNELLVTLSDVHFGHKTYTNKLFKGEEYNSDIATRTVAEYGQRIIADVDNRGDKIETCHVLLLGDILHTSNMAGETVKGTPVIFDKLGEELFEIALNSIENFIELLRKRFSKIVIHNCAGNHEGFLALILGVALQRVYRNAKDVQVHISKTPFSLTRIKNTLCVFFHGYHDIYKAKLPNGGSPKASYIQSLFLAHPEKLVGIKSKICLTGDRHKMLHEEFNDFEHIIVPSMVLGDNYADALNLRSFPRQLCFVVDDDGIKETWNFRF